ncbi:RING/U-box superfamily protein [Raphanus sativus]|nr:RING/U-box superfamily protein [Raphanus sativus]
MREQQQVNIMSRIPSEDERDQDYDVVESTASAFDRHTDSVFIYCAKAKRHKSRGSRRGPLVVDLDSATRIQNGNSLEVFTSVSLFTIMVLMSAGGGTTKVSKNCTQHQSDQPNVAPVEEPKFNCPICLCPFTEEMSTKCGHIFCKNCIKEATSRHAKCPTCREKVTVKDLIRVFLPTTG